jgi:hypothetical protein
VKQKQSPELTPQQARNLLWNQGELSFILDPHQLEVKQSLANCEADEILFFCARQWGKSFYNCVTALEFAIKNPGSIVRIAAPTLKQAQEIVESNLIPIAQTAPKGLITRTKSEYRWNLKNGSSIRLGALERAHVDSLRGGNAKLIIAEEGGFVNSDDYQYAIASAIGPQLLRSQGTFVHVTTPSEQPDHFIHTEILPKCELSNSLIRRDIYTNTALSAEAIEKAARRCGGAESEAFRREYLVQIVRSTTTLITPEFSLSNINNLQYDPRFYTITAIDFGGVLDPTAVLILQFDYEAQKLKVLAELTLPPNTNSSKIVEAVKELEAPFNIKQRWGDASGLSLFDLRDIHDFQCSLPIRADKQSNIAALRVALANQEILIDETCKKLIAQLNSGQWNKSKTEFLRTAALGHCDLIDALAYGFRMIDRNFVYTPQYNPHTHFVPRQELDHLTALAKTLNPINRKRK